MKKNRMAQKSLFSAKGYFLFFLLVCGVATCAILAYSAIWSASGESKPLTAILTLVVLLVIALVCTVIDVLRRKFSVEHPVQTIIDATECVTKGDFSVKLAPRHAYGRFDEFDIIMENINRMTAELSKNEVLKTDFIANVSHEIKTPLALIRNYASGLCADNLNEAMRKEYAQTLLCASVRLSDLITNILQLNKLENQEIFPEKIMFDLGEQLRECVLQSLEKVEQKEIQLGCDIADIKVCSAPGLLEIIWNNLISNAIKFTNKNGQIDISLKEEGSFAIVRVSDSGCGILKEEGDRIFDKFYQADTSRATDGNGLGLALVKRVIDILGGEIFVDSVVGKGSTFTIKIRKYQN